MAVMPIEWGKIREFALATANGRPEYLVADAPIPPTFLATVILWDDELGASDSTEVIDACRAVGVEPDWAGLLSLEQEYVFHGPLPRAGDRLLTSQRFDGVETKQASRGVMVLVRFSVLFHGALANDEPGPLRAECRYTSAFLPSTSRPGAA